MKLLLIRALQITRTMCRWRGKSPDQTYSLFPEKAQLGTAFCILSYFTDVWRCSIHATSTYAKTASKGWGLSILRHHLSQPMFIEMSPRSKHRNTVFAGHHKTSPFQDRTCLWSCARSWCRGFGWLLTFFAERNGVSELKDGPEDGKQILDCF